MLDVFILQMFSEKLFQIYPYSATRKIFNTLCPNQTVDKEVNSVGDRMKHKKRG